ncbi:MAG: dipeptidyl peptidase 3 [Bacteroidia bacterium]|nr:dipeptidyl peptidase 3 [Bacteroidia bacterium]NNF30313.1 dihydrofolate reductase [Flavobacteriaceae bacterium]MBT8276389.1 dipeptidyl peptidase 3 [Bacteroidia bacterium]NNJ80988.1 dihydrofolate reductase [Flavobacteriaceae bacterium]NNK53542.1 dihydrofolate reductase [Flavobacteriaceae bacterium]
MMSKFFIAIAICSLMFVSCADDKKDDQNKPETAEVVTDDFKYQIDQFADLKILRYQIPSWNDLSLDEQKLVYYLTQAGLAGRDIMWAQNYRHNLTIRKALENIYTNYDGDKESEDWKNFEVYLKRVWFSNGIHHHYSTAKLKPDFSAEYLRSLLTATNTSLEGEAFDVIFNDKDAKKVNLSKDADIVLESAINFYGPDVTTADVENYYGAIEVDSEEPIEIGLNTKLVKENGQLVEKVYKSGGLYGGAIDKIIYWLEKAKGVAEDENQAKALGLLIEYYKTGSLDTWDDYAVAWVNSTEGDIDWINGFIEVYNDPKGYKGSYETIVEIKDFDMSKKMAVLSKEAQWFEDNSPLMPEHKKKEVKGVSYKTVIVAGEAGDASPSTPIGVNLPNNNWIRQKHGSKSVSLGNIINSYNNAGGSGRLQEFAHDEEEVELEKKYGQLADKLHTALHEVVGHASGQINPGVGTPKETLKSYKSTIEEGRADLFGLYYLMDPKLQELGLVEDWEATGKAAYDGYIRNGLITQLVRLELGDDVEESHMRNRQWVSAWAYEKGEADGVIEKVTRDGKTFYDIKDYAKLREIFGMLLKETQRITSEGDYEAAKALVEDYGVKVDQTLHKEVLERNSKFEAAPYGGFVNPVIVPDMNEDGEITGFSIKQPETFEEQMLNYSKEYGYLSN